MNVDVIIPVSEVVDEDRANAFMFVQSELHGFPWAVHVGVTGDPWCKARAVQNGLSGATGDVVVVHDADVWCDGLTAAVQAVKDGAAWAIPHRQVYRLHQSATRAVYETGDLPSDPRGKLAETAYVGHPGGGIVVLRRDVIDRCPLDPRFVGWGQEDDSWARALEVLHGAPWRGRSPLWHLWHEPQPRMTRRFGSTASKELWDRYKSANTPHAMRALMAELVSA